MADEDVARGRSQSYLLVSGACLLAGLVLQALWQPAIEWPKEIASGLFTTGLIAVLWSVFVERWQARDRDISLGPLVEGLQRVRDEVHQVRDSLTVVSPALGVHGVRLGEMDAPTLAETLRGAKSVDAACLYDTRWRESWAEPTKAFLGHSDRRFRIVLPDPTHAETVTLLAKRHCKNPQSFRSDIDALMSFLIANDTAGTVEIRVVHVPGPSHTVYLFHSGDGEGRGVGISRMYDHVMGDGKALPELGFDLQGTFAAFHLASFAKLWQVADEYYPRRRIPPPTVAVIGPGDADPASEEYRLALALGRELGDRGINVATGGLGGIMAAASRGIAFGSGGRSEGFLPTLDQSSGNVHLDKATPTGKGQLRNQDVVGAGQAVVAIGCNLGTFSEIALAAAAGKPLFTYKAWEPVADDGHVRLGLRLEDDATFQAASDLPSRAAAIVDRVEAALNPARA